MLSSTQCRTRAKQYIAQAKRTPRHKTRLLNAAQAWLLLAGKMKRIETPYRKLAKLH